MNERKEKLSDWGLYQSFEELEQHEEYGKDYDILIEERDSKIAILAPHGGYIEPGTTEIARLLAGNQFSVYSFCGLEESRGHDLHITSRLFDEPRALALAAVSRHVVTIHSMSHDEPFILIGGRAQALADSISRHLAHAGFLIAGLERDPRCAGMHEKNICNRGISGEGVQIELSTGLLALFAERPDILQSFLVAVRQVLEEYDAEDSL